MQLLSDIVRDTDENFGLGNRAAVLVSEAARILFDEHQGGLKGVLGRLEEEGLGKDLSNWRDTHQEIRFPEGLWVDKVFGTESITRIGRDLGMANARVRTALAYVIPHLIRYFTAGSSLPEKLPQPVEDFLAVGSPLHVAPRSRAIKKSGRHKKNRSGRRQGRPGKIPWAIGVIVLLLSGFFLGYDVLTRRAPNEMSDTLKAPVTGIATKVPAVEAEKVVVPQPNEEHGPGSKLVIRSYGNQIDYLGFVSSAAVRDQVIEKLQKSFGAPRLSGEFIVDPERSEPQWIAQLDRLLPLFSVPGLDVRLEGNTVRVGGWLAEEDRTSVLNNLMSTLGASYRFGYLREEDTERSQDARQYILAALVHMAPESKPQELIPILNRWVINFPEGSAAFPDESRELAARIAEVLKAARTQAVIEIQGHVDAQGSPASAQKLSLERANAVRDALIKNGVSAGLLRTKGYGSDKRLGTGSAAFDHARNARIEFRVIQVCDPYFPCETSVPVKRISQPDPNASVGETGGTVNRASGSPTDQGKSETTTPVKTVPRRMESDIPQKAQDASGSGPIRSLDSDEGRGAPESAGGSKLKALSEELPPPAKPRPKPPAPPRPPEVKPQEWYDPLGLF